MGTVDPLGLLGTMVRETWEVREIIGRGGLSIVYRARHLDGTDAALKAYLGLAELPPEMRVAFRRTFTRVERMVRRLAASYPAIVRPLGGGWLPMSASCEIPCMFLEWLEGQTLESHLDRERMTPLFSRTLGEVLALMEQPMAALAAAHERGLVHRDIKPSNFFVCAPDLSPGVPIKMLDFGLAKLQSRGGDRELPSPVAFMTPTHAAPEQFRGEEGWVGPWTDVFGLALVLVEMMRGGGPALTGSDFAALRDASMDTEHRPTPQRFGLEVAGVVEAVFERALAVDPSQRFQTIGEFSDALHAAVERERRVTSSDRSRVCGEIDIETTQRSGLPGGSLIVPQGDTEVARAPKGHLDLAVSGDTVRAPCPVRSGSTVRVDIALVDDSDPSS